MNYYFTGILIILMFLLALFGGPVYSKNEYLNDNFRACCTGEIEDIILSLSKPIE